MGRSITLRLKPAPIVCARLSRNCRPCWSVLPIPKSGGKNFASRRRSPKRCGTLLNLLSLDLVYSPVANCSEAEYDQSLKFASSERTPHDFWNEFARLHSASRLDQSGRNRF